MEAVAKAMTLSAPVTKTARAAGRRAASSNLIPDLDGGLSRAPARAPERRARRGDERGAAVAGKDEGARREPVEGHGQEGGAVGQRRSRITRRRRRADRQHGVRRQRQNAAGRACARSWSNNEHQSGRDFQDHSRADRQLRGCGGRGGSRHGGVARRRHRARARLPARHGGRDARIPARRVRHRAEPRRGQRRHGAARRVHRRSRKAIRSSAPAASSRCRSAKRCSAASSTRSASRSTARVRS